MKTTNNLDKIKALLHALPEKHRSALIPATQKELEAFKYRAIALGVNKTIIDELLDLCTVANNFRYEVVLEFHSCTDESIFEWWEDGELWLGQNDCNTLRWVHGKFCLGGASNISYTKNHEYPSLLALIKGCINEINELNY
ncbi:hypothetical protein MK851_12460 [Tenacibaculum sp. 1B UA]|uniref:hypothetical protein n=1 Tax=Tenacibaculum sp. 1B UA TaxID=2922252 RepID=UPI002A23F61F|nr:hypothetical protein [Tenacibaculum sp. 1B UA]MDX8554430.1 hypothetical protein [Tenacibaculum sp. 1B UA]